MHSKTAFARNSHISRLVAVTGAALAVGLSAHAATGLEAQVSANHAGLQANGDHTLTSNPIALQGAVGPIAVAASAWASYGTLHAASHGNTTGGLVSGYSTVSAWSKFTDSITITGGTGTGFFMCDFEIDGSIVKGGAIPAAGIQWSNVFNLVKLQSGTQTVKGTFPIQFTYGVPFEFSAQLSTLVTWMSSGDSGFATANFANTAHMTNPTVRDAFDNIVKGVSIKGSSGFDYTNVPAPGSLAPIGVGLLLTCRRRRK